MAELQRKKQKSVGTICKDAIMTGISYMIPVIVGGGVITAIAKMMGGYNIGDTAAEMQTLAQVIFTIGNNLFAFAVPCLAAFIAYAIADKPGIAPTYIFSVVSAYASSDSFFTISGNSIKWEALTRIVSFSLRICPMFW